MTTVDMEQLRELLARAADGEPLSGTWMLMAKSTSRALAAQCGAPQRDSGMSLFAIPILLDDEMPHGSWRLIARDGRTVRRSEPRRSPPAGEIVDLIAAELARHTLGPGHTCACGRPVADDDLALPEWDRHLASAVAVALTHAGRLSNGGMP